ncbi:MAG: DUF4173 domain-containing protein [Clostridiales bacterium]|nr:DUF4173 domain-containing protein [Clostridiales bacterium]
MNTNTKRAETLKVICLGLSYVFSYAYINLFSLSSSHNRLAVTIYLSALCAGAILWLELSMRQLQLSGRFSPTPIQKIEPRFWEAILLLLAISTYNGSLCGLSLFFIHMVVIYMVQVGTGHLLTDRSSCLMPMDLTNGCFRLTFGNIGTRFCTVAECLRRCTAPAALSSGNSSETSGSITNDTTCTEKRKPGHICGIIGILFFIFIIFNIALSNLASVDKNFSYALFSIDQFWEQISISESMIKFLFSLPVGAFLFGLYQGCVNKDNEQEAEFHNKLLAHSTKLRIMPDKLFAAVMSAFIAVYLAFYVSQASYMFSAFAGVLPEAFTASEYAVSGFHELINVVIINFILLSLVRIFGSKDNRLLHILSIVLMAESMVFAAISASKIILYMSRFGYTVSRTLGLWGTSVVFVGAALAIVYLVTRKRTFAPWLWYASASYVIMEFISWAFV